MFKIEEHAITRFVFLHIGQNDFPKYLVASIREHMPAAEIIQCSDDRAQEISGIDRLFRLKDYDGKLMTFRLRAFAELELLKEAIYLDTDILLLRSFNTRELIPESTVGLCRRHFYRNDLMNMQFGNLLFTEFKSKTVDDVFPYIASFTITPDYSFWRKASECLLNLEARYHYWFGDQEAIKRLRAEELIAFSDVSEAVVSCLPEFLSKVANPLAVHFKGAYRKKLMLQRMTHGRV